MALPRIGYFLLYWTYKKGFCVINDHQVQMVRKNRKKKNVFTFFVKIS